jgi:hypothetical protein
VNSSTPDDAVTRIADLGRDLEALRRRLDGLADVRPKLSELVTIVDGLTASAAQAAARPARMRSWLGWRRPEANAPGVDATAAVLRDLRTWISAVFLRYADAEDSVPECWLWHPDVVEELLWLSQAWTAAYAASAAITAAADWHDRLRPGVVRRLRAGAATCSLDGHVAKGGEQQVRPLGSDEHIAAAAKWWATGPEKHQTGPANAAVAP